MVWYGKGFESSWGMVAVWIDYEICNGNYYWDAMDVRSCLVLMDVMF